MNIKILCLHGFQNNAKIIQQQSKYFRSIINHKFIIPNAPNLSYDKPEELNTKYFLPPYYHWYNYNNNESLKCSIDYLQTFGKFDGILGFSQGSAMATHIFDIIEPKFFISIAGVNPELNKKYNIPSIHFIGKNDKLYKRRSCELMNMFTCPEVVYFEGGHEFLSRRHTNELIKCKEFIKKVI